MCHLDQMMIVKLPLLWDYGLVKMSEESTGLLVYQDPGTVMVALVTLDLSLQAVVENS